MHQTINPLHAPRGSAQRRRFISIDRLAALAILGAALSSVLMVAAQTDTRRDVMGSEMGGETTKAARIMAHGL